MDAQGIRIRHFWITNLCLWILVFCCINASSQNLPYSDLINEPDWHEGSILLTDETEIIGLINYNNKKGTISFESGSHSRTYTARNVIGFEFHDSNTGIQRIFYSLEHNDNRSSNKGPFIFEVLRDLGNFSILYKVDPLDFEQVNSWQNSGPPASAGQPQTLVYRNFTKITQNETVYLFTLENEIVPLIEMTFKQSQGREIDRTRTKSKLLNKDVLARCMGDTFSKVEAYAKENKMYFEDKDHLMQLLDFYWALINE